MEKIIGIVSEYNPFHIGHNYHIAKAREMAGEESTVVCVMSGDYVQRGEWAIQPKHLRAQDAVRGGADLVFELPLPWCLSSARVFAEGAVNLLASVGITDLSFGSECGKAEDLYAAAEILSDPDSDKAVSAYMREHPQLSYPAAREAVFPEEIPALPNDLLAVEYLRAIRLSPNPEIKPLVVRRSGYGHDMHAGEGFQSASAIREEIYAGRLLCPHISADKMETAILSRLRMFDKEYFCSLPDCADGLGTRLYDAVRNGNTLNEIYDYAKTKCYTHSRVRRGIMCAALSVKAGDNSGIPPYARILAMNEKGVRFAATLRNRDGLNLVTQPKEIHSMGENAEKVFALGASAHDLYMLCFPDDSDYKCGDDYRIHPIIVQDA